MASRGPHVPALAILSSNIITQSLADVRRQDPAAGSVVEFGRRALPQVLLVVIENLHQRQDVAKGEELVFFHREEVGLGGSDHHACGRTRNGGRGQRGGCCCCWRVVSLALCCFAFVGAAVVLLLTLFGPLLLLLLLLLALGLVLGLSTMGFVPLVWIDDSVARLHLLDGLAKLSSNVLPHLVVLFHLEKLGILLRGEPRGVGTGVHVRFFLFV